MATYVKGNAVANATSYELWEKIEETYTLISTNSEINFEVSALDFAMGNHTLVVKAKADGYEDSDYSNEVVYNVANDNTGSTAEISGVWTFGDTVDIDTVMTQDNITVYIHGNMYIIIETNIEDGTTHIYAVKQDSEDTIALYSMTEMGGGWTDEHFKQWDFGSEPQIVTKEFYDWLTANATQTSTQTSTAEISGLWTLNETVTIDKEISQSGVNIGMADGYIYLSIDLVIQDDSVYIFAIMNDDAGTQETFYAMNSFNEGGWVDDAMRDWDFSSEPQTVSIEFYNWLTANATQTVIP